MKFIINADDLGLDIVRNNAIQQAIEKRIISSTTIMGNTKYLDEVKEIVKKYPFISYGIHLSITEGLSLSKCSLFKNMDLVDDDWNFKKTNRFTIPDNINTKLERAIYEEWKAQVEYISRAGINISHIDGHHHCHTWYGLEDVLFQLVLDSKIKKVRNRKSLPIQRLRQRVFSSFCQFLLRYNIYDANKYESMCYVNRGIKGYQTENKWQRYLRIYRIKAPTYFESYQGFYINQKDGNIHLYGNEVIELMCHPGHENGIEEMNLIERNTISVRKICRYNLISYNDL